MSKEADYDVTVRISELRHTDQTIRRLRALASGYRDRCRELIKWATMGPHGLVQHGAAQERARIVARLREYAETVLTDDPDYYPFKSAADIIESEEP